MRLGINLGYWGAGMDADNLAVAQEADRLGYSVCWAAEAYGSDAPTVLSWVAAQTERIDVGSRHLPDPGPHPGDDRDDRRHPRLAVRRPLPARPRRVRPAGLRGLVRRQVRQAAVPHPRVRRDRPQGDVPRAAVLRGRALDAAAARRPRQADQAHRAPGARAHPAVHRRDRPEEPGADRRDRRRRPADLPLRRAPGGDRARPAAGGPREGRPDAGRLRRLPDACRSPSATTRRRSPTSSARTPRSTSAAWAAASRTSTTSSPGAWATRRQAAEIQDKYLAGDKAGPRRPCRSELIDSTCLLGPVERIADRMRGVRGGRRHHPPRSRRPASPWRSGSRRLRAGVEALELAGLA